MESQTSLKRSSVLNAIDHKIYEKVLCVSKVKYGVTALKLNSKGKANPRRFYLNEYNKSILQWISPSKTLKKACINLTQIHKTELGGKSLIFSKLKSKLDKDKAVTLYYSNSTLDLIFSSDQELFMWLSGIQYLIEELSGDSIGSLQENIIDQAWRTADKNNSGNLNLVEIKNMMKSLNLHFTSEAIDKIFKDFDKDNSGQIDKQEFKCLVELLMQKPEIDEMFFKYSSDMQVMSLEEFSKFFREVQGELKSAENIFSAYSKSVGTEKTMDLVSFREYILSLNHNSIIREEENKVNMDMNQPLSHYFIASSHNTYLEGNQLTGTSSIEQYSKVLLDGCRCVEIDTWNGEEEPVVTHGHTLVNKVSFREVLQEIRKSAFHTSPYPVIISLENHCDSVQTEKIGTIFQEVLGDLIYIPTGSLKTPQQLMFKIIIKAKITGSHSSESNLAPNNLSRLVGLVPSTFSLSLPYNSIVSLSEKKLKSTIKKLGSGQVILFHLKAFTRIYPLGTRINSSNYNPILAWCHGSQIAAVNYQSFDIGMLLNQTFFRMNGRSGYILKPDALRNVTKLPDFSGNKNNPVLKVVKLEVISGFNLPKIGGEDTIISPFIQIEMHGIPDDCSTFNTRIITKNGFNPVWKEIFVFNLRFPEVCFVVFKVFSKNIMKDIEIAQAAVPIYCMRQGYRTLELLNSRLEQYSTTSLLLKVEFE